MEPDRPKDIYNLDIRLSSTTSLPNGTNVPYTLSMKAKPFVRGTELRLATYRVEKVLAVNMKKPPKGFKGKVDRVALKAEYQVTPLLPGMPPIKEVVASVEVDYDAQQGKVLQVAGLEKVAKAVKNAVDARALPGVSTFLFSFLDHRGSCSIPTLAHREAPGLPSAADHRPHVPIV